MSGVLLMGVVVDCWRGRVGVAVGLGMEGKLVLLLGCRDVVWIVNVVELDIAPEDGEGGLNGRIAAIVPLSLFLLLLSLLVVSSVRIKKLGVSSSSTELESNSPFSRNQGYYQPNINPQILQINNNRRNGDAGKYVYNDCGLFTFRLENGVSDLFFPFTREPLAPLSTATIFMCGI
jgi:hypothetical protein